LERSQRGVIELAGRLDALLVLKLLLRGDEHVLGEHIPGVLVGNDGHRRDNAQTLEPLPSAGRRVHRIELRAVDNDDDIRIGEHQRDGRQRVRKFEIGGPVWLRGPLKGGRQLRDRERIARKRPVVEPDAHDPPVKHRLVGDENVGDASRQGEARSGTLVGDI
jgi:hypothetical protein